MAYYGSLWLTTYYVLLTMAHYTYQVLLEGPQSYFLSNAAEKIWDSGTSANTDASGMLCASRLNLGQTDLRPLFINIHKTPGSSRVGRTGAIGAYSRVLAGHSVAQQRADPLDIKGAGWVLQGAGSERCRRQSPIWVARGSHTSGLKSEGGCVINLKLIVYGTCTASGAKNKA